METHGHLLEHSSGTVWDGECWGGAMPGTWTVSAMCMIDRGGGSLLPCFPPCPPLPSCPAPPPGPQPPKEEEV